MTLSYIRRDGRLEGANGPTGDDVAGLGNDLLPDQFSNFTVDLALMPEPGIDIEKSTNGEDADTAPGPNVATGGAVRWTYVVTNAGGVDLTDVTVTDDVIPDAAIDCDGTGSNLIPGPLAPGGTVTCVATGVATTGQYENLGTTTGIDPTGVTVTDDDPSHYMGERPTSILRRPPTPRMPTQRPARTWSSPTPFAGPTWSPIPEPFPSRT